MIIFKTIPVLNALQVESGVHSSWVFIIFLIPSEFKDSPISYKDDLSNPLGKWYCKY